MRNRHKILLILPILLSGLAFGEPSHGKHGSHNMHGTGHGNHMAEGAKEFDEKMQPILAEYLKIHKTLMTGKINDVKSLSEKIIALAKGLDAKSVAGEHAGHYKHVPMNLTKHAKAIGNAKDLSAARESFKKLSQPMAMWVGMAKPKGYSVMFCPMLKASWVQKDGETQNPYDNKMRRCGSKV